MSVDKILESDSWFDPTRIGDDLDAACDRFEAAWRAGERPRIEDLLVDAADLRRATLLRYLLAVELDYRRGLGEFPELSEYHTRFAGDDPLVDSTFAAFTRRSGLALAEVEETVDFGAVVQNETGSGSGSPGHGLENSYPQIPGFELISELGRGGMGVVYQALNRRLNRLCALKMVLPGKHASAEARIRFLAEAETIARLKHPNLVQIYSLGNHEGRPYFEMEYLAGGNLSRPLGEGPWAPEPAARMLAALARAIGDVHRLGIVHRDLKPANILLTDDGTPKIVDFGLAKSIEADSSLTLSGVFVGTPSYAAPEQVLGSAEDFGPAADIYALGAIFYHMLTGRPPFQAAMILQTLGQVRTADPVPPSRLRPSLPRDVEIIALKCLERDPHRRYVDAAALAEDLDRFQDGRTILARPAAFPERLQKWARRRPAVATLSILMATVSLLSFVLVVWQWRRAEAKAVAADVANDRAQQARLVAFEGQAQLMFHRAMALCDQGEVGRGISWLARSLELATAARSDRLIRPLRINLADWSGQLIRPRHLATMQHPAPILALGFRRKGEVLVSVGQDGLVRSWDVATGKEAEPAATLESDLLVAQLNGDWVTPEGSDLLGRTSDNQRAAVRNLEPRNVIRRDGQESSRSSEPRGWQAKEICQPDGGSPGCRIMKNNMPAPGVDGSPAVVDRSSRRPFRRDGASGRPSRPGKQCVGPAEAIASTSDGRTVITGRRAGRLHVWDAATARGFDLPPQETEVTALSVMPDGRVFASGTEGGVVRLWDSVLLGPIGQTIKLASTVNALAFDPSGRVLAVGEDDGTIRLWDLPPLKSLGPPIRLGNSVQSMTFGAGGQRLLIGTTKEARWYDLAGRTIAGSAQGPASGLPNQVEVSAVSPDGRTMAIARSNESEGQSSGRIELHDATNGRLLRQTVDQSFSLAGLAYSPDSKWLLTWGAEPKTARLWDVASLRDPRPISRSLDSPILQAVFSRDGRSLLLGCRDGKARLWDLGRDAEIQTERRLHHAYPITAVAFDPTRSRLVTGCHAGTIRLWDANRGDMLNDLHQNAGEIAVLAFSPDGSMLVTASYDGTARFLDAESGKQLGPTMQHTDAVLSVAFDPNGRSIATGTRDGIVQRWSVPAPPEAGEVAEIRRRLDNQPGITLELE